MQYKSIAPAGLEVKNEERGEVRARFATLKVRDKDGDYIEPGAFGTQAVLVSAYGHATWRGALPVGKGTITEKDDEAIADLKFFMDTETGREHFRTIKNVGAAGEWSFGYEVLAEADPDDEQREKGIDRVIKKFKVFEVSPVFRGAGVNTATLAVKHRQDEAAAAVAAGRVALAEAEGTLAALEQVKRRAPSAAHGLAAAFSVDVARRLLHLDPPPSINWEPMDAAGRTSIHDKRNIYLNPDLAVAEVPEVVLHEVMHTTQWLIQSHDAREREATAFGEKWADSVFRSGWATGWDADRVRLVDGRRPPTDSAFTAEVVLCKGSAEAWVCNGGNTRPRWRRA